MKIVIVGCGYIGTFLGRRLGIEPVRFDDRGDLSGAVVINAVGYCGRKTIDECEDDVPRTLKANVSVPCTLARESKHLIHISSGCIFDGYPEGGFTERCAPNFVVSAYTASKRLAELELLALGVPVALLRIRMPLSTEAHPRNLITKLQGYARVIDRQNSVTWLPDFADAVAEMPRVIPHGIFHVVNAGTVSPFELNPATERLESLEGLTRAGRSNTVLSTQKLNQLLGYEMPSIRRRLQEAGILA